MVASTFQAQATCFPPVNHQRYGRQRDNGRFSEQGQREQRQRQQVPPAGGAKRFPYQAEWTRD